MDLDPHREQARDPSRGRPRRLWPAVTEGRRRLGRVLQMAAARVTAVVQRVRGRTAAGPAERPAPALRRIPDESHAAGARRVAWRLSVVVAGLLTGASAVGLTWRGLYQDAPANAATFRAYDLGALALTVPVLAGALARARRGSPRADLLWAGMLASVVYTYAYYVFGAAFNALFLVHVAVFVLAAVALGALLAGLDVRAVAERFADRTPVRAVAAVLALLAGSLGAMWTYHSLRFAVTGAPPDEGLLLQPPPIGHLGYAMDLTTLVPAWAVAAVLLWRRRAWGYVLGAVLLVASAPVQLYYLLALRSQATAGIPGATAFDPQEPPIAIAIVGAAAALLAGVRRPSSTPAVAA